MAGIEMPQGEPGAVLDAVNRLDRMASGFEHAALGFRRAAGAVPSWLGFASVAFQGLASSLEQTAAQAQAAIQDARVATRRYAEELREARQRVKRLQDRAQELEQEIDEAKRRAADAARREEDARARAASALLSAPFDAIGGGGAALDAAAAAFEEADAAAVERRRCEDRITELEDELERVRREAQDERARVRQAENRAAAQVEQVLSYFPQVESASAPTRQELIEGGHVLPPGKLTSQEAQTYLDAYEREHNRHFSAMDRLSLLSMLAQGERPPDMRKLKELYEEPGWVKATNEFTGLADAERALDSFANGNILGGLGSLAMAVPVGPGKLGKVNKLDDLVRGGDDAASGVRKGADDAKRASAAPHPASSGQATFGTADRIDYRRTYFDTYPGLEGKVVVHHAVEQQALKRYGGEVSAREMHSLENLRGIPKTDNPKLHLKEIRREWDAFYREHPNATREQLLEHATRIDDKFGHLFDPPVR